MVIEPVLSNLYKSRAEVFGGKHFLVEKLHLTAVCPEVGINKMKSLIAFMCVLAVAFASECGPLQRLKVKRQWAEAYGGDYSRASLGHAIWNEVFDVAPAARDMFKRVRGDNIHTSAFRAHSMRVLGGLDMCIALLDEEDILTSQLGHLAEQHTSRGVGAAEYDVLEGAVMKAVEAVIGSNVFDEEAWEPCLDIITNGIQG